MPAVSGFLAGVVTGAVPFLLIGFRTTSWVPAAGGMLVAGVLCATAWRNPLALGMVLGTLATAGAFVFFLGSDQRLLPYVMLNFPMYYVSAAAGFCLGAWSASRRSRTGPATGGPDSGRSLR